jgi:hypothetical protein
MSTAGAINVTHPRMFQWTATPWTGLSGRALVGIYSSANGRAVTFDPKGNRTSPGWTT